MDDVHYYLINYLELLIEFSFQKISNKIETVYNIKKLKSYVFTESKFYNYYNLDIIN